eukprot:scaffold8728_cov164-Amphora_coffeaeformis.AAC.5
MRLLAVALANGWDAGKLPKEAIQDDAIPVKSCQYEDLKVPSTEEVNWGILDVAFAEEELVDDDDIRQKLAEYKELRRRFEASQHDFHKEEERLKGEVEDKYQAALRRKMQFLDKLQSVTKEVQQLEVDISVTLAAQDMAAAESEEINVSQQTPMTQTHQGTRIPVSFSPPTEEGVVNPYQRRTNQPTSGKSRRTETTPRVRAAGTPITSAATPHVSSFSSRRKRKSDFGSSMKIGGKPEQGFAPPRRRHCIVE